MKATRKLVMLGAAALAVGTVFVASASDDVYTVVKVPFDNLGGTDASVTEMQYTIREYTLRHNRLKGVSAVEPMVIENLPTKEGCTFGGYYTMPGGQGLLVYDEQGKMAVPFLNDFMFFLDENSVLYPCWIGKCVFKFDFNGGTSNVDRVEVMTGEPLPPIKAPIKKGYAFTGYSDDERFYYDSFGRGVLEWDQSISSRTIKAHWTAASDDQGVDLQQQINSAPNDKEVEIQLSSPVVDLKEPLIIPEGKDIHLSRLWIGRAALDWTPVCSGQVFRVLGKLTLENVTVFGGSTIGNGGGILIGKKGELRLCNGAEVCMNRATGAGGGIFGEKYSCIFLGDGFSIKDNMATVGSDVEMPCGSIRICSDANRESEEWNSLTPYSPGMMLLFK